MTYGSPTTPPGGGYQSNPPGQQDYQYESSHQRQPDYSGQRGYAAQEGYPAAGQAGYADQGYANQGYAGQDHSGQNYAGQRGYGDQTGYGQQGYQPAPSSQAQPAPRAQGHYAQPQQPSYGAQPRQAGHQQAGYQQQPTDARHGGHQQADQQQAGHGHGGALEGAASGLRRLFKWRRHEEGQQIERPPEAPLADPLNLRQPVDPDIQRLIDTVRGLVPGPRLIAFVNPKGGAHKTTASVLTAASFGILRQRGVLAWDDNELRGTLGLRAGTARHGRTIKHLLYDLPRLEATGGPYPDELDAYLRRQEDGCFDVLAADEDPKIGRLLTADMVRRLTLAVARSHQIVIVDTGNNIDSDNWRTIVERADQLVVITLPREDAAFAADWMLEQLVEEGYAAKVEHAVTVFSTSAPAIEQSTYADLASHFASRTRAVIQTPYDPALDHGGRIHYPSLQPITRDAWVRVAAVIAQGL